MSVNLAIVYMLLIHDEGYIRISNICIETKGNLFMQFVIMVFPYHTHLLFLCK